MIKKSSFRLSRGKAGPGACAEEENAGTHDRIIADAAKTALGPLGFRRKGRSRLWLADHHWWLAVVEFQPSQWSRGAYLNVAAHWLWSDLGHISFDFGGRAAAFLEFRADEQFALAAARLADSAAQEARRLAETFVSPAGEADVLLKERASISSVSGWPEYHAGVAAGLIGRVDDAEETFRLVLNGAAPPDSALRIAAERMIRLVPERIALQREVNSLIDRQRSALRLPPLDARPF